MRLGCPGGTKSRKSDKTKENYTHIVNGYLIPELGTKPIARLSANDVDQALRRLAGSGLSRNTLRLCRTVLSLALGYAERRGLISRNPAKGAPLPDAPERKERRSLTVEEARKVLGPMRSHPYEPAWIAQLTLGLRPSEALRLRWDDVDEEAGRVTIHATKNVQSVRVLGLPQPLRDALERQRDRQDGMRAKAAELWKDEGYITTTDVGGLVGTGPYRTAFKRLQRRAGITDEIVPYELRHTLTSMLMDKGIRDTDISDILGHKDPRILYDTYRHLMVPEIDPHEEALADIFAP